VQSTVRRFVPVFRVPAVRFECVLCASTARLDRSQLQGRQKLVQVPITACRFHFLELTYVNVERRALLLADAADRNRRPVKGGLEWRHRILKPQ
jgi:hypothetical protein